MAEVVAILNRLQELDPETQPTLYAAVLAQAITQLRYCADLLEGDLVAHIGG